MGHGFDRVASLGRILVDGVDWSLVGMSRNHVWGAWWGRRVDGGEAHSSRHVLPPRLG